MTPHQSDQPRRQDVPTEDVAALVDRCRTVLGPAEDWVAPRGYPDSLALCILDSIWSIGIRYTTVEGVVHRYRQRRTALGGNADTDGACELLLDMDVAGGVEEWRQVVATRHRTSTRGGISKAEAVALAAQALIASGIATTADLQGATEDQLCTARTAWCSVRGQRSGISWRYMLLLSGRQQVKPDRMICRFCAEAIGSRPTPDLAAALVTAAAADLGVDVRTLDHRIWRSQSGRA